jgi:hypothetical protein
VDRVRKSAFNRLGNDLLDLLGNNRVFAIVQGVGLGGGLVGLAAGGVDLEKLSAFEHQSD